jgi:2-hydroxy-3-keto-5-methylthiopentenyl-1-phosphate phosphatase
MEMRPGLPALVDCCRRKNFRFVVISNGLDFYIEDILKINGLGNIEVHAAQTRFSPGKLVAQYVTPSGVPIENGLKEAYVDRFLSEGYRVIYIGNGVSDIASAVKCHHVFATGELLDYCSKHSELDYMELTDFFEAARVLEESF